MNFLEVLKQPNSIKGRNGITITTLAIMTIVLLIIFSISISMITRG